MKKNVCLRSGSLKAAVAAALLVIAAIFIPACGPASSNTSRSEIPTEKVIPSDAPVGIDELNGSWFFEIIIDKVGDKGKGIFSSSGKPKNTDFIVAVGTDGKGTVTMNRVAYQAAYKDGKISISGPAFSGQTQYKNIDMSMDGAVIRSYKKLTLKGTVRFYDSTSNEDYATGTWDADKLEE